MRYITERELRDQFAGGVPEQYQVPADCRLTPAARQYLMDLRLYRHAPGPRPGTAVSPGGVKPEHMTNLNARELVCKTHPRILLRGKLDTLESDILVLQTSCGAEWRAPLGDALNLVRAVLAAEVREGPLAPWTLDGMSAEEVHRCSHHPEEFGFPGHILPAPEHGLFAAQLNRLRAITRETELAAVQAFWDGQRVTREDIILALNRLSSYFYVLQLRAARR
ncbi:MAG: cobalamin adenosyltransferase [Clostridia bacterium]|nr:cobalamin adenosyltransferase [Clostridia bacterium]